MKSSKYYNILVFLVKFFDAGCDNKILGRSNGIALSIKYVWLSWSNKNNEYWVTINLTKLKKMVKREKL